MGYASIESNFGLKSIETTRYVTKVGINNRMKNIVGFHFEEDVTLLRELPSGSARYNESEKMTGTALLSGISIETFRDATRHGRN